MRQSKQLQSGNIIYSILVVGLIAVLIWIAWYFQKPATGKNQPQKQSSQQAKLPQAVIPTVPTPPPQIEKTNKPPKTPSFPTGLSPGSPFALPPSVVVSNLTVSHGPASIAILASNELVLSNSVPAANEYPRPVRNALEAQVALMTQGISPGSIDGAIGSQTRSALAAFQMDIHIPVTGQLDAITRSNLTLDFDPYTNYVVSASDLARLQPVAATWLEKSKQTALDFENILELVAEKSCSHPSLIKNLNPAINWGNVPAGTVLRVPNAYFPEDPTKAAVIIIKLAAKTLEAYDAQTNLICHFPCSIARRVEKRPVGELKVAVIAVDPNYTFDPAVFPESEEAKTIDHKLIIPPGPNNPVGVAWIGLDKPGYGMHGTPHPEEVGRTESHGCFRLANWNARYLVKIVSVGTPVLVQP